MPLSRVVALTALATGILLALLLWLYPSSTDFRATNPFWNGLRDFRSQFSVTPLDDLSGLPRDPHRTVLVLIPYRPLTGGDLQALQRYLAGGGILFLLDDYRWGNQVLEGLALPARFSGAPLVDPLFYYKNNELVRVVSFTASPLSAGVSRLVLNHATVLQGVARNEVVASSSPFSFLDTQPDRLWEDQEPLGPFPVIAFLRSGDGMVVAVSDPSILINGTIALEDNQVFISNALGLAGPQRQVFLDTSHLPLESFDRTKAMLGTLRTAAASSPGALLLAGMAIVLPWLSLRFRKGV
ncbi:MAG: hypothetical protein HY686_00765 [Chloroflexi bacterium]|nr:hypothetical protein [Chloroflexota bacterium]